MNLNHLKVFTYVYMLMTLIVSIIYRLQKYPNKIISKFPYACNSISNYPIIWFIFLILLFFSVDNKIRLYSIALILQIIYNQIENILPEQYKDIGKYIHYAITVIVSIMYGILYLYFDLQYKVILCVTVIIYFILFISSKIITNKVFNLIPKIYEHLLLLLGIIPILLYKNK